MDRKRWAMRDSFRGDRPLPVPERRPFSVKICVSVRIGNSERDEQFLESPFTLNLFSRAAVSLDFILEYIRFTVYGCLPPPPPSFLHFKRNDFSAHRFFSSKEKKNTKCIYIGWHIIISETLIPTLKHLIRRRQCIRFSIRCRQTANQKSYIPTTTNPILFLYFLTWNN